MSSGFYNVGLKTVTNYAQLGKDEPLQHNGENLDRTRGLIQYLHLGLYVGADCVGLSGELGSQCVVGVLLVKLALQGVVTQRHQFHCLRRKKKKNTLSEQSV